MDIRNLLAAALVSASMVSIPASAQDRSLRTFTMDGNWALDAGEDYCRLAANFADGDDVIAFALERNRAENFARLILIGDAIRPYRGTDAFGYSYQPENDSRTAMVMRSETSDGRAYFNLGNVFFGPDPFAFMAAGANAGPPPAPPQGEGMNFEIPPYDRTAELEFARTVRAFELADGLREDIRIETGSMRAPVQALQACADDLLRVWGLDFQRHQTMSRRAAPDGPAHEWIPGAAIGFEDFALLGGGSNAVRVMVDEQGKPTQCTVHWPSLSDRKNAMICDAIMQDGSFIPALDAEGNPMASYWMTDTFPGLTAPFGG